MKKICVITGSRAEYGLFYPIMQKIQESQKLSLQIVATTMHLSPLHQQTYQEIENDGFCIDAKINNLLPDESNVQAYARLMSLLPKELQKLQPDVVLLLGDRFETHAAATVALLMNIPIAHIHGGEITEGAVDEQLRHAITKMSHLHFVSTAKYKQRVLQMGELPESVIISGAPGIDNILSIKLKSKHQLQQQLDWQFGQQSVLFTYHPETLADKSAKQQIDEILAVIEQTDLHVLFTGANADTGGEIINERILNFVAKDKVKYKMVHHLGMHNYFSVMSHATFVMGNSSSGIIEAASFSKAVIDIGDRQKGRLTSGNVIHTHIDDLFSAVNQASNESFIEHCQSCFNIYGNGQAADIIVDALINQDIAVKKQFVDK